MELFASRLSLNIVCDCFAGEGSGCGHAEIDQQLLGLHFVLDIPCYMIIDCGASMFSLVSGVAIEVKSVMG